MNSLDKILLIASFITLLFCIFKFVEMKFIDKEMKPLKTVIRDAAYVLGSSLIGVFVFLNMNTSIKDFMNVITDSKNIEVTSSTTQIFTGEPGF
jgi:hypothetical protein